MIAARTGPSAPVLNGLERGGRQEEILLAQFALVSLAFGGVVAGVALAPVWPSSMMEVPGLAPFGNYELLAASGIGGVALISATRRKRPLWWLVFLLAAFTGATIVMIQFAPYYTDPWITILGWSASTALLVLALSSIRKAIELFGWFMGFERGQMPGAAGDSRNTGTIGILDTSLTRDAGAD